MNSNTGQIESAMFDFADFYDRVARQLPNDCKAVEVGVANGASAIFLAKRLNELGKTFKLYMVDNMDYGKYDQLNDIWRNIHNCGLADFIEIIPKDSVAASQLFNDNSIDFCFLDSSHLYEETKKEIPAWYPKLKDDCILAGHDAISHEGVSKAIKEVLPEIIKRTDINEPDHKQNFLPHKFLHIQQTDKGYGVWYITKVFYWQPGLQSTFKFSEAYIGFLNLDHRTDRLTSITDQLKKVGLKGERTRGRLPDEFDLMDRKFQVMKNRTPGAIGCHYGQVEIMEKALAADKHAIVFEDDCIFCNDFQQRMEYIENFLNTYELDFDIFWLGGTVHINPAWWHTGNNRDLPDSKIGKDAECTYDLHILRTYGAFCTYAYIVNKKSIKKVLDLLESVVHESMGIDWAMIKLQPQLKTFMFVPGCVKQMDNQSDIGAGPTIFSGFARLGAHWFQDNMKDFNPLSYEWAEAKK